MSTVKINVNFLAGEVLDHMVSHCVEWSKKFPIFPLRVLPYPTDWAHGGPIIEREGITIQQSPDRDCCMAHNESHAFEGPTPLIAAMRCYVASKLGEIVEVPSELFKEN